MMDGMAMAASAAPGQCPGQAPGCEAVQGNRDGAQDTAREHDTAQAHGARLVPRLEGEPGAGLPFAAFLNPVELQLASKLVDGLEPRDPQEEIHCWHLAVSHILAAQRFGKSRQDGLSQRAEQIEVGLAVRVMTLADRKSNSLDRHRARKDTAAREARREARLDAARREHGRPRAAHLSRAVLAEPGAPEAQAEPLPRSMNACFAAGPGAGPRSEPGADSGSMPGAGPGAPPAGPVLAPEIPGHGPGQALGQGPGQAPLSRQQRRALARREKKAALRAAALR